MRQRIRSVCILLTAAAAAVAYGVREWGLPILRQLLAIQNIERVGGKVSLEPAQPEWLPEPTGLGHTRALAVVRSVNLSRARTGWTDKDMVQLRPLTSLTELDLSFTKIGDAGLANLEELRNLSALSLDATQVTDAGLQRLMRLTNMRDLSLRGTRISGKGLAPLAAMGVLRRIDLSHTPVDDDGLAYLGALPGLEELILAETAVTNDGLNYVKELGLRILIVSGTRVTDEGLKRIERQRHLERLDLARTRVTDSGLEQLSLLTRLQHLDLTATGVTDSGLRTVRQFENLRHLEISKTRTTAVGVAALRRALPRLNITGSALKANLLTEGMTLQEVLAALEAPQLEEAGRDADVSIHSCTSPRFPGMTFWLTFEDKQSTFRLKSWRLTRTGHPRRHPHLGAPLLMTDEANEDMINVASFVGVALAAVSIWLAARIINRREAWAIRTAVAVAVLACAYFLISTLGFYDEDRPEQAALTRLRQAQNLHDPFTCRLIREERLCPTSE